MLLAVAEDGHYQHVSGVLVEAFAEVNEEPHHVYPLHIGMFGHSEPQLAEQFLQVVRIHIRPLSEGEHVRHRELLVVDDQRPAPGAGGHIVHPGMCGHFW